MRVWGGFWEVASVCVCDGLSCTMGHFVTGMVCISKQNASSTNCNALDNTMPSYRCLWEMDVEFSPSSQNVSVSCPFLTLFNSHLSAYSILLTLAYIMYNYLRSALLCRTSTDFQSYSPLSSFHLSSGHKMCSSHLLQGLILCFSPPSINLPLPVPIATPRTGMCFKQILT